jgi:cytochrome c5
MCQFRSKGRKRDELRFGRAALAAAVLFGMGIAVAGATEVLAQAAGQQPSVRGPLSEEEAFEGKPSEGGRELYMFRCATCHNTGLNGAPKIGDKLAWQPRIEKGKETLYDNAINGIRNMPPKGGFPALKNEDVKAAVDFMITAAGGDI